MKWTVGANELGEPVKYTLESGILVIQVTHGGDGWGYRCPAIDLDWTLSARTSPVAIQREAVRVVHKKVRGMFLEAEDMYAKYGRASSVREEESR